MSHHHHPPSHPDDPEELTELWLLREILWTLRKLLQEVQPSATGFTQIIQENPMVPLAAGQTATFSTTPIPSNAAPTPSGITWTSSDTVNAPVSPNSADTSGLSTLVVFPASVVAGVTFSLTVSYTNSDGTTATQTNSFTTVAPPPTDVTGFNPIVQTA
jgi:hypothetical protein